MHPFYLFLLLPLVLVTSQPVHQNVKQSGGEDLPNEFWSQHFGPDFNHAIHLQLKQTDLISANNVIEKTQSGDTEGNKKRSAYIVHKPNDRDQENRTVENSMRVHLLQPGEIEALEKGMVSYSNGNKMLDTPVVINLPASQGSNDKNSYHATPVVLNMPPVVYHSNPNYVHPSYLGPVRRPWAYNRKYPSIQNHERLPVEQNMMSQQGYEKAQPTYEQFQPMYEKMPTSYEHKAQNVYEAKLNPVYEEKKQHIYDSHKMQQEYESHNLGHEGAEKSLYMHSGYDSNNQQAYNARGHGVDVADQKEKA